MRSGIIASSRYALVQDGAYAYVGSASAVGLPVGSGSGTYTVNDVPLGPPSPDRTTLLTVVWENNITGGIPSGVTINGAVATIDQARGNRTALAIARLATPTGTTGQVVVTVPSIAGGACHVHAYSVTGGTPVKIESTVWNGSTLTSIPNGLVLAAAWNRWNDGDIVWAGVESDYQSGQFSVASGPTPGANVQVSASSSDIWAFVAATYSIT